MLKTVRISHQSEIEAQIPYENVFSKRIITNIKDNSDKMSFNHVEIKAGWEHILSNDDKDEIVYFIDGTYIYMRQRSCNLCLVGKASLFFL